MKKQSFIIIGLGTFGTSLVRTLAQKNVELLVIDKDPKRLEEISSMVLNAVCADASNPDVLKQLGVSNFDGAVVSMGHELESSVLITMQLKEMGVKYVMAKAINEIEARVLRKVGADKVISPDKETGIRIANQMIHGNYFEAIELSFEYSITDFTAPFVWIEKALRDINVRSKYGINVIAVKKGEETLVNPSADYVIKDDDILVILGKNEQIQKLRSEF